MAAGEAQAAPSARALQLMDQLNDKKSPFRKQLCIAVQKINVTMVAEDQRPLTQVWLPGFTSDGVMALTCDCAPYAISGDGDRCSLFRCLSCRYTFRPTSAHTQGSIGRVFVTHQPELCSNLGEAPAHIFHRAREAKECSLRSMCTMPLWMPEITKNAPMAVIEILQPEHQPDFDHLQDVTSLALKTVTETQVSIQAPTGGVILSQCSRGASRAPDEAHNMRRGRVLVRSTGEGNSWEGRGASPGIPERAWNADESTPHDAAVLSGQANGLPDMRDSWKRAELRSLPIPLSGNSTATPTSALTPDTQVTTGATASPLSDDLAAGLRRSASQPPRDTPESRSVTGLQGLPTVDPSAAEAQILPPKNAQPVQPPLEQRLASLTQSTACQSQDLQEAAQQRVLAFVQAQAQTRVNNTAVGLDMLSLTTPSSGEVFVDRRLNLQAPTPQMGPLLPAQSQFSNSGGMPGSGEMLLLADGRVSAGQLACEPVSQAMTAGSADLLPPRDGNQKAGMSAGGGLGNSIVMPDLETDIFADGWELGGGSVPCERRSPPGRCSSVGPVRSGMGCMMQMPNAMHAGPMQPFASAAPAPQQTRNLSPSRRMRHVMEEASCSDFGGTCQGAPRGADAILQDSVSAELCRDMPQSESQKYVVQKVFSDVDLESNRVGSVRPHKKRISPGPGQRRSGGLPDMPGPSTTLPFMPDLNKEASLPRSADAALGTHTSPPHPGAGPEMTGADRGGSLQSPEYSTQLRQFAHPGASGSRDTFVRIAHRAGSTVAPTSAPFTSAGPPFQPNASRYWKVPTQGGLAPGEGTGAPTSAGMSYQTGNSSLAGAHVIYQRYANDVKALRSKVNRIDGGIGRKVTLDLLKRQFGKGLKEAADDLGMCPTTLKRACRRLGVKRWPRTAEAAQQALKDAEAAQRDNTAAGRSDDDQDTAA